MTKWINSLQPFGALLMRLALGVSMAVHGYQKVIPHGALNHYAHYIASLHLPYWLAYVSAYTEFAGGILLILGVLTRFACLVNIPILVGAVFFVNTALYSRPNPEVLLSVVVLLLLICFLVVGNGPVQLLKFREGERGDTI